MNTSRTIRVSLATMLAVVMPQLASAQPAINFWDRIIGALERNINHASIRERLKDCAPQAPSAEQFGKLSDILAAQGVESPSDQNRWINQLQCPAPAAPPKAAPTPVMPRSLARLTVRSDRTGEPVQINGIAVGVTPMTLDVDTGGTFALSIGERDYRRDTTVVVPPERTATVEVATIERNAARPPVRSEVELELTPLFRPVPELPSPPKAPSRPTGGGSFGMGLLIGGVATAAALSPCTSMATAPSPYGGFVGSTYYPAGTTVPSLRFGCAGAAGGAALIFGSTFLHAIRKATFRGRQRSFEARQVEYGELESKREQIIRANLNLIDSTMAYRRELATRKTITRPITIQISTAR